MTWPSGPRRPSPWRSCQTTWRSLTFIPGVQRRCFRDQDPVNIAAELVGLLHGQLAEAGTGPIWGHGRPSVSRCWTHRSASAPCLVLQKPNCCFSTGNGCSTLAPIWALVRSSQSSSRPSGARGGHGMDQARALIHTNDDGGIRRRSLPQRKSSLPTGASPERGGMPGWLVAAECITANRQLGAVGRVSATWVAWKEVTASLRCPPGCCPHC